MEHNMDFLTIPKKKLYILILLTMLLLSGCMTTAKKDGPPPFPVDASKIPDAVPKVEPLSRIGNPPSYVVFGKRYYVMKSNKNYVQVGIASWYGTKFHQRRTSDGEKYDMLAMTAAHKTLPLPTYVEVTNLENHRKVIVKVNDRGPFEKNRLIDLSYVAAKKLGMTGHGTAWVRVKAINPEIIPDSLSRSFYLVSHQKRRHIHQLSTESQVVYLEVGKFRQKNRASQLQHRLAKWIKKPVKVKFIAHHAHRFYKIQIGPLRDRATVDRISQRLKSIGLASRKVAYAL